MMLKGFSTALFFSSTPMFPAFHATIDADGRMRSRKKRQEYDTTQTEQLILIGCRGYNKAEQFYLSKEPLLHHILKDRQLTKVHQYQISLYQSIRLQRSSFCIWKKNSYVSTHQSPFNLCQGRNVSISIHLCQEPRGSTKVFVFSNKGCMSEF